VTDPRLAEAVRAYDRVVFAGDASDVPGAERALDAVEADIALARGRLLHARYLEQREQEDPQELSLFERAAQLYAELGDARGEGEAVFWVGIVHQVIRGDHDTALPLFERSLALATAADDKLTQTYALRHLGFVAAESGDTAGAREHLLESTRLRRDLDFGPGVAANLIALAHVAAADEKGDEVRDFLDEADQLAADPAAAGIRTWVAASRTELQRFLQP
jgi:tetratricopeptide (TPR) repeat protein